MYRSSLGHWENELLQSDTKHSSVYSDYLWDTLQSVTELYFWEKQQQDLLEDSLQQGAGMGLAWEASSFPPRQGIHTIQPLKILFCCHFNSMF